MTLKKVLVDAHVEIDINMRWVDKRDIEYYAKRLAQEAENVKEFVRDHKSMDINDVYVVKEYETQCEFCHYAQPNNETKPECCEKAIREWATQEELIEFGYEIIE